MNQHCYRGRLATRKRCLQGATGDIMCGTRPLVRGALAISTA